ncbi:MAG: hypothetical protein HQL02_06490 [Nitrospirae bacterium]|nr:hypothetical protein [Nitrospirota bacterium]
MANEGNGALTMPMFVLKGYGYSPEHFKQMREVPLQLNKDEFIVFLNSIADKYPFMVVIGLRVLTEKTVKEILAQKKIDFNEKTYSLSGLMSKLCNKKVISEGMCDSLKDLLELENRAVHGCEISVDIARWALNTIPDTLNDLHRVANQI